jgi:hypothetical protein
MDKEELVRGCYEWQIIDLKCRSWAKKLSEDLNKIGLGYIWYDPKVNCMSRIYKKN